MEDNGWLRLLLDGISKDIKALDEKFDAFAGVTCPERHKRTAKRVDAIEREMQVKAGIAKWVYAAIAGIAGMLGAFGDKIWHLLFPS